MLRFAQRAECSLEPPAPLNNLGAPGNQTESGLVVPQNLNGSTSRGVEAKFPRTIKSQPAAVAPSDDHPDLEFLPWLALAGKRKRMGFAADHGAVRHQCPSNNLLLC
jgi:hypothetical protein